MSLARFSDESDVYIYTVSGKLLDEEVECCGCMLRKGTQLVRMHETELNNHLIAHEAKGHKVEWGLKEFARAVLRAK